MTCVELENMSSQHDHHIDQIQVYVFPYNPPYWVHQCILKTSNIWPRIALKKLLLCTQGKAPATLKCSESKMRRARKLKPCHHLYLVRYLVFFELWIKLAIQWFQEGILLVFHYIIGISCFVILSFNHCLVNYRIQLG